MEALSLDLFTGAVYDVERTQYKVLGGLQRATQAFSEKRIYPYLGRLVNLHQSLRTVMRRSEAFRSPETGEIQGIDLDEQRVNYAWPELDDDELSVVKDLIRWALPKIQAAIEEGKAVYEHVEDNLAVEEVGIVPAYVQEGYMLVPNRSAGALHVLRYTLSMYSSEGEKYRTLRTEQCDTMEQPDVDWHPSSVKLKLIEERKDLPNPATFFFDTDLAFPYQETLLPVAKRRMMRVLAEEADRSGPDGT